VPKPDEQEEVSEEEEDAWRMGQPWEPPLLQPTLWHRIGMLIRTKGTMEATNVCRPGDTGRGRVITLEGDLKK